MNRLILFLFLLLIVPASVCGDYTFNLLQNNFKDNECYDNLVSWIYEDIKTYDSNTAKYIRYFTLFNKPYEERLDFTRALSGHVNQLSKQTNIRPVQIVQNTNFSIVKVNILDYDWPVDIWEKLADVDPYFHILVQNSNIETLYPGPFPSEWFFGGGVYWRYISKTKYEIDKKGIFPIEEDEKYGIRGSNKKENLINPTILTKGNKEKLNYILQQTQTNVPFVRADWFIKQTLAQNDRNPGYYDFLGIKDKKDFDNLVGFDLDFLRKHNRFEILEAVAKSNVAQQPRRIAVYKTVGEMHYRRTFDSKQAKDEKNPLRILDDNFKHDAEEIFAPLPNGFWAYGLFNDKGVRQDSAPDFIGFDKFSKNNDGRIEIGISCMRCHYSHGFGDSGIIPYPEWAKNIFKNGFKIQSVDYNILLDIETKYFRSLELANKQDIENHNFYVNKATGLKANDWAKLTIGFYNEYETHKTIKNLAIDLCIPEENVKKILENYAKGNIAIPKQYNYMFVTKLQGLDLVLAGLMSGQAVGTTQYEEIFPLASILIRGAE